ncbi:uncharacterized protein [Typha latifolia]|uniref:uncharacterized protein n=1 Tax=Typha latifolia TaxID=4733 RepID=UPI003C2D4621
MWVCMSRKLDVFKLTREMIESVSQKECPCLENLDAMQKTFTNMIKSKKVLLVLDDVWCYKSDTEAQWEQLLAPLAVGERGSKILVTARPENMPNMPIALHSQNIMKLKNLRENEFVSLFMYHAFRGSKLSESHLQEELEKIGKQILQKLCRSPLAAKAVGGQLSKRLQPNFWRASLEQDNLSDTQKALMWSYYRLDASLQRCFSYISLFPKGHMFTTEEMVDLWMAEGFVNLSTDNKKMEDIGNDYFDELVSGSFLQPLVQYEDTKYYGMHDLFHDLAENVSKGDYFRIEDDPVEKIPSTVRHLYVSSKSRRNGSLDFLKLENLRTLIVGQFSKIDNDVLLTVMEKSKKLRVLDIPSEQSIKALPKCIRDLKHLRYLSLYRIDVAELPVSLCKLHHLQLLKLPYKVRVLPRSLTNLFNLRHLKEQYSVDLSTLPNIGRLTSLQELEYFEVKKENGHDIGQLKNLNELRGLLTISGLENVEGKDEATGANLKDKKHLDSLLLKWYSRNESDRGMNLDMEIVEALQPPPNLTKLLISGCKSLRYPSWLVHEGCLENLKSLYFFDTSFKVLPTISSKLFPRCQELEIRGLPNLRTLPLLPQTLRKLVIESCPLLVFVSEEELQKSDDRKNSIVTVLRSSQLKSALELMGDIRNIREMVVRDCLDVNKLMESEKVDLPKDFQTFATALEGEEMSMQVDYLHLWEAYYCCQEQRLEAIFRRRERSEVILPPELQHLKICSTNITDGALSLCLGGLSSLETLNLRRIRTITTVQTDHLMALCDLEIDGCHCLKSLGGLHALLSLKALRISSCPCLELEMMEGEGGGRFIFPPSLKLLSVGDNSCCNVKRFAIGYLPDLETLLLDKWSSLASLSLSGLTALRYLSITGCPQLSAFDCSQAPNNSSLESLGGTEDVPKLAAAPPSEAVHLSSVEKLTISSSATLSMLLSVVRSSQLKSALELMGDIRNIREMVVRDCLDVNKLMESEKVDLPKDFQRCGTALQVEEMSKRVDYLHIWEAYCRCQEQRLEAISGRRENRELVLPSALQHLEIASINISDGALSLLCLGGLTSLKTLKLEGIRTITTIPTDHLMALCDLEIDDCHCLRSLGGLLALLSLTRLSISSCPCLELEMMGNEGGRLIFPPSLQSLSVSFCCNVKSFSIGDLPDLHTLILDNWSSLASLSLSGLTTLRKLRITDCPQLFAVDCSQALNDSSLDSLGETKDVPKLAAPPLPEAAVHLSSVEELEISSCATLSILLSGNNSKCLAGLGELFLWSCPEESLHEEHFKCLISLKSLVLYDCKVQCLSRILKSLSSLEQLALYRCPYISSLSDLPETLLTLWLEDCPGISSLPVHLPGSLRGIAISRCQVLEERCREPKGEDWPKIAHIPFVSISD